MFSSSYRRCAEAPRRQRGVTDFILLSANAARGGLLPTVTAVPDRGATDAASGRRGARSVFDPRGDGCLGVGETLELCLLVGHREEPADAARDRVFRERRVGVVAEFVEARVAVRETQLARFAEMLGDVVGEDLERTLDASARRDGGLGRPAEIGVVEV